MAHATSIPSKVRVYRGASHVGFCSAKRALSRVRSHRATWRDDHSIEMCTVDPRDVAERRHLSTATQGPYDSAAHSGAASLRELHNIPVSNARRLLGMGRNTGAYSRFGGA